MGDTIEISSAVIGNILALAVASSDEICGLLLYPREGGGPDCAPAFAGAQNVAKFLRCANVHPDPARNFEIDPAAQIAAHRAQRSGGPRIIGCFHSHPSGSTTPSPRDAAAAAPDGWVWLIVAHGEIAAWRAVRDGAVHGRFDPVKIEITQACA